jgi:hypothetical protein
LPKERDVAIAMSAGAYVEHGTAAAIYQCYNHRSHWTDFADRKVELLPGDTLVKHFAGAKRATSGRCCKRSGCLAPSE